MKIKEIAVTTTEVHAQATAQGATLDMTTLSYRFSI